MANENISRRSLLRALGMGAGAAGVAASTARFANAGELTAGLNDFLDSDTSSNRKHFESLADSQAPHSLVITCSDSRIDAEHVFSARPGDIFHLRNIANIVPDSVNADPATMAVIEYAVSALEVSTVAVMAHSNCGGMAALQHIEEYKEKLPITYQWLQQSLPVINKLDKNTADFDTALEQANAAAQLENLMSHEFIAQRVNAGKLELRAYHYNIGKSLVTRYNPETKTFENAGTSKNPAQSSLPEALSSLIW